MVKPKPEQRGPIGFAKAKLPFAEAKEGHNKRQLSGSPR